ncbi:MAG: hypothetical protein AAF393_14600 [Pseudomonadota bacterium]
MSGELRNKLRKDSEAGVRALHDYYEIRKFHHIKNGHHQSGWAGELPHPEFVRHLPANFGLSTGQLSSGQIYSLTTDILRLAGDFSQQTIRDKAMKDKETIEKLLKNLKRQQEPMESLSKSLSGLTGSGCETSPDVALAKTIFELEEYWRAVELTLDETPTGRGKLDAVPLCRAVIITLLKWVDCPSGRLDRGLAEAIDRNRFLKLPSVDGKFNSDLRLFIEATQDVLCTVGFECWDFSPEKPARKALRELKQLY